MTTDNLLLEEEKVVECFTLPALRCAWERVLKKDAQDGDISDSVERFAEGVQERLEELTEELRAGTFWPSDLTRVVIPKKNGERFLDIPSVRDRIVERAILEHINPAIDPLFGATAFGYRPGLGVADAAQEVVRLREEGYTHVLRTDMHDCFPSLPVALLRRQLEFLIAEPEILVVVDLLLDRCTRFPGKGRGVFPGLPQGSPLSPLLANLALIPLDEALVDAGFPVVRYADDLVIALEEPGDAPEALRTATKVLKELGMELGAEKTAVASFFEGFAFLGEDFGPRYPPAEGEGRIREPDKKILYVAKQGSRIQVRKGRVQVIQDDHELLSVPVSDISRMVCFGSVGVTAGARNWALQNGVDVLLASRGGGLHRTIETTPKRCTERRPIVPVHDSPRRMRDRLAGHRTGPGHGCPARRPRHPPQPGPRPDGGVPPTRGGPRRGDGGPQTRSHRVARPGGGGQGRDFPHRGGTGTDAGRLRTQNTHMRGRGVGRLPLHQTRPPVPTGPAATRSHHGPRTEMDGTGMAMMHLAAYDVHEDQRRAQFSALLQAYGDRIQYSVFLLGITPEELVEIQSRAAGIIDENTDSLWIVRQCAACWEEARTLGQAHPPARVLHYTVM
ncbi:Group II intron-encoded protein ltrA [Arachnia propionica]|uniref:CRISPR-associated endoribonuclease Cas2 n=2 Tax=Arachnia propionica TaxID=1750 RepID=A0A3S4TYF6_9ACTN|nr:CRISPR-associated endonuclease Cas2 [Arachnia propionica]VEH69081.1 Group II intron-encoded protein ltrA [Arachnia propionica]